MKNSNQSDSPRRSWAEPWKIKVVEPVRMISRQQRTEAIKKAG
jgi:tyrosine phenol-lyase